MSKGKWAKPKCFEAIKGALQLGKPLTAKQLAPIIGMSYQAVKETIKRMHGEEPKLAYIAEWDKTDPCHTVPRYLLGDLPDVAKPAPKQITTSERMKQYRQIKQEREEEQAEMRLELEIARKAREAIARPAFRHPQDIALFGEPERRAA